MSMRAPIALLAVASAVGLAACGGSDTPAASSPALPGDTTATATTPAASTPALPRFDASKIVVGSTGRAEIAKQADAICASAKAKAKQLTPPANLQTDPGAGVDYFAKVAAINHEELRGLTGLRPTAAVKADYVAMVSGWNDLTGFVDTILAKVKAKDPNGLQDLASGTTLTAPFVTASQKIGATGCAAG